MLDRFIGDPIRIISDILHFTQTNDTPGILFAADFAAAFDSVDYNFMFAVLKSFRFAPEFIHWVRILHLNIESCVLNNGISTGYFNLNGGMRQGDPLASYLFLLVIEVLANMVRNDKNIKGIIIDNVECKQCLFADDSTFF